MVFHHRIIGPIAAVVALPLHILIPGQFLSLDIGNKEIIATDVVTLDHHCNSVVINTANQQMTTFCLLIDIMRSNLHKWGHLLIC